MSEEEEVLKTLKTLVESIPIGDLDTYKKLTHESLTCFEPESNSYMIEGLPFHEFFMNRPEKNAEFHTELINPVVRVFGDTAYAAYALVRLKYQGDKHETTSVNETRIFHKFDSQWKMVHFHRS